MTTTNQAATPLAVNAKTYLARLAVLLSALYCLTVWPNLASAEEAAGSWRGGWVERALFTSAIAEREPVDALKHLRGDADHVYFFTELRDMSGLTIAHRWEREGVVEAEVSFAVGGPRWRVWSRKGLDAEQEGRWRVSVVNQLTDETLMELFLDYGEE
ncbi:hypothetical protein CAI21_17700 [Alkalilimnicola ehrlichii]|uniref:DUF2914 domain-containing protein n=1 Tax=Alkalilimnicola ehrlichii TaxID=351052 RepID=A0A3E0WH87_9GAMM|nr:DUF2914 domain-containing protein [Alkalilimnicola ehrlichii]RFA26164.1 hypothetical protein CAI21_17700 [Alkalilimnicola ehrlichii]RFA32340.1 hypothetical protein CAL65_19845 [Alkalilimnicola ehrlichii]